MSKSMRQSPARTIAGDGITITLRTDSVDIAVAQPGDCARLFAELAALGTLSRIWRGGICRGASIEFNAQHQPILTAQLPHASPRWTLLSSIRDARAARNFASAAALLLHHWHALGVVHRSLSPSSILVDADRAAAPDEDSVVLLAWGGAAVYNWGRAAYACAHHLPHPSAIHAAPERLSFSLEMFSPVSPAEDWFSLGRIIAAAAPRRPRQDSVVRAGFSSVFTDPALAVLVSGSAADVLPPVISALLEPDPPARRLNGHAVSVGVRDDASDGLPRDASISLYRPTGIAWPVPGLELHHDGVLPVTQVLCFKTHLRMKSLDSIDSSSFLVLGCSIVQSLFVMWNAASQTGFKKNFEDKLDLDSPSFFFVPERHAGLNLHKSIMAALDNREISDDAARTSAFASAVRLSENLQIDRDAIVSKLGDLYRQDSRVITVLVPIYDFELMELVEINSMLLKNNTCAVFVALVDPELSAQACEISSRTLQIVDLNIPLAEIGYIRNAVSSTLNLPEPLLSTLATTFEEKVGSQLGSVISEFILWAEQLVKNDIIRYVPHSGMVHVDLSAISSAPVSTRVAADLHQRITQPEFSQGLDMLRICSAASATCSDTCFYELPVELALVVADVSRSSLDAAISMGLVVSKPSEIVDRDVIELSNDHFRNLPFQMSQVNLHIRFVQVLHSQIVDALTKSSTVPQFLSTFRPGLISHAVLLTPVISQMNTEEKREFKTKIMALCEHLFALSSVGQTGTSGTNESSASSKLPSHSDLVRFLLLGVQLSNSHHEYNKARTFASAGVSLLSSLEKSVTSEVTISLLHFQIHCDTLVSFANQNVAQGIDSEKLLLKQYSEGGSSRWCSGVIFSALMDLSQSVNFMQRCCYHDAFSLGRSVFATMESKSDKDSEIKKSFVPPIGDLPGMLSKCLSHKFWFEETDHHSGLNEMFLFDAFERLILSSLSCGMEATLNLLFTHLNFDSGTAQPISLTTVPIIYMSMISSRTSVETPSSSVLLEFMAERIKNTTSGLHVLQAALWTALSILPFSSSSSISAFVDAYSIAIHPVDALSEMTSKPFESPYNGSSLLGASHMLDCIATDFLDVNECDLSCTARFFSAALAFISGCDVSHLNEAVSFNCTANSLSLFGERLLGSLMSVVQSPVLGQACCRKDAELLPDAFYSVVLSVEALWNVILGDWESTLSATKRASVLKTSHGLPIFQLNIYFCSCVARLHKLLAARDDAKTHLLAEAVNDLENMSMYLAPDRNSTSLHYNRTYNDSAVKSSKILSSLITDSSALMMYPGSGMFQIACALFSEFLGASAKQSSDAYDDAYRLCTRDGLHLHSALACHLGHAFVSRLFALKHATSVADVKQLGNHADASTASVSQDGDGNQLMLETFALRHLERSHALFSAMRIDIRVLSALRVNPSLVGALYPDSPLSNLVSHMSEVWFGGLIMHDRLLRIQGYLGVQHENAIFGPHALSIPFSSKFTSLLQNSERLKSELSKIQQPSVTKSPISALIHAAQLIGRTIGAQRAIVLSKTTTSVSVSSTIDAIADVTFCPAKDFFCEDVVACCSQPPITNPEIPDWLAKYGFTNKGVHIFQNVSTSFGSNLLSDQQDGDGSLSLQRSDGSQKLTRKSSIVSSLPSRVRSSSSSFTSFRVSSTGARRSSTVSSAPKRIKCDTGLSSVVMLSWGKPAPGNGEPHVSYMLWFEHRDILGAFGPDFHFSTFRVAPDVFHPSAHPMAFVLSHCLLPLEALVSIGDAVVRNDNSTFTKKDIDEDSQTTQIADRQPIVGILWKRGSLFKSWKERHFQLFNTTFKYYHKDDKINSLNSFEITHDTTLLEVSVPDRKEISAPFEHCFCLMSESRQLYLCADQGIRMKKWMKVLSATIEHARKMMHRSTESFAFNACVAPPPLSSMTIVKRLGVGGFGEVFLASWNGLYVAVKKMTKELTATSLFRFRREADMMSVMRHPNILTYMACSLNPPNLMIVMEYMSNGSLLNVLQDKSLDIPFKRILSMANDCSCAMVYLHSASPPILHRDLKAENLLVDANWTVKVADFGLARNMTLASGMPLSSEASSSGTLSSQSISMTSNVGSIRYCAPELLTQSNDALYNEQADVYSFGIILWELVNRPLRPFHHVPSTFAAIQKAILSGDRPRMSDSVDAEYAELYRACVQEKPSKRPSFDTICRKLQAIMLRIQGIGE